MFSPSAFRFKTTINNLKTRVYKVIARPVITYACEDKRKLSVTERRFLRRIYGSKKNNKNQKYEIRTNEEIHSAFGKSNIIAIISSKIWSWFSHMTRCNTIEA